MKTELGTNIPAAEAAGLVEQEAVPDSDPADRALFADLASGDRARIERAIDAVSRGHRARLERWLVGRGVRPDAAEDLAQDSLIRLLTLAREGRIEDRGRPIEPLLHAIAFYMAREDVRHRQATRAHQQSLDVGSEDSPFDVADPSASLDFGAMERVDEDRSYERIFAAALDALSPSDRELLDLKIARGLTVPQIAEHLRVNSGAAHTRLSRAVARLVKLLPATAALARALATREPRRRARAMRGKPVTI